MDSQKLNEFLKNISNCEVRDRFQLVFQIDGLIVLINIIKEYYAAISGRM
jgi:hypothetical protein